MTVDEEQLANITGCRFGNSLCLLFCERLIVFPEENLHTLPTTP